MNFKVEDMTITTMTFPLIIILVSTIIAVLLLPRVS